MINIREASVRYQKTIIFDKLTLTIKKHRWTAILGPSGIGKSSLLKLIAGLLPQDKSCQTVLQLDHSLSLANDIAYLPQNDLLLPWLPIKQNLLLGPSLQRKRRDSQPILRRKIDTLLEAVHLSHAKELYPHQLSGGMRQRVALAQLLLQDKPIILMDEPFQSLDAMTRFQLQSLFATFLQHKTVVFITHDLQEASRLAHHIYFMHGTPATLSLSATLDDPIPRELTAANVIQTQTDLYPLWSKAS